MIQVYLGSFSRGEVGGKKKREKGRKRGKKGEKKEEGMMAKKGKLEAKKDDFVVRILKNFAIWLGKATDGTM